MRITWRITHVSVNRQVCAESESERGREKREGEREGGGKTEGRKKGWRTVRRKELTIAISDHWNFAIDLTRQPHAHNADITI